MLVVNQVKIPVEKVSDCKAEQEALLRAVAKKLNIEKSVINKLTIQKKSMDARKKPELYYVYSVTCHVPNEEKVLKKCKSADVSIYDLVPYEFKITGDKACAHRPVIVGMGPAGLFCGYMLAKHGYKPILLERGRKVEERTKDVEEFWENGCLLHNSNVQFGEGGAGTFSDGKLNTLVKDKAYRGKKAFEIFIENGAPKEIMYEAKPHIGTDLLRDVIKNMRNEIPVVITEKDCLYISDILNISKVFIKIHCQ